ncbi:hypothetical protein [Adhaeribacter rhizoryzae]|uniref:Lipoprotein n=1 Tax=Adhaeribacter rhizoryzae TaxID=2607907 RepID=A0A5M6DND1_9BACT|nr:hypothetical protein [Adhaeribacter rhizoryzae]KAA5547906.1 hypothetical protein F0145_08185 [Adhaeribacter rhizoryzae]
MPRPFLIILLLVGTTFSFTGCVNTRLVAFYSTDNIQSNQATRVSYLWGIVQPQDIPAQCESKTICKVNAKTNLGYILVSAVTLGIVVPQKIVWDCCPSSETEEKL